MKITYQYEEACKILQKQWMAENKQTVANAPEIDIEPKEVEYVPEQIIGVPVHDLDGLAP